MSKYVIMACGSLAAYVAAAQAKMGTNYPVVYLDKALHADPPAMRRSILAELAALPEEYDTVLVAMGFCGGSWQDVASDRRIVRPRVDDCVSLLLHTESAAGYNLKQPGHLYMKDPDPHDFDMEKAFCGYTKDMPPETRAQVKAAWQANYDVVAVVDTGLNRCDRPEYKAWAEKNAAWIDGRVEQLKGSNYLIEKLVAGDWDEDLFIVE